MVQVIATSCSSLASNIKSHALKFKSGPMQDVLRQGAAQSDMRKSISWPRGVDKNKLLKGVASVPSTYLQSFSLNEVGHHFVCPYDGDGAVALMTIAGPNVRILAPAGPKEVFAGIATLLQPTEAAPPMNARYEWEPAAFAAFCAIVDRIRTLFASSLVLRQGVEAIAFDRDALEEQLKTGAAQPDYRWLCAMLPHLLTSGTSPSRMLASGCAQLEGEGLLASRKEAGQSIMAPSAALTNIALQLVNPLPAIVFSPANVGSKQADGITAILCGTTFWRVTNTRRTVELECVGGLEALSWLGANLKFPKAAGTKAQGTAKPNGGGVPVDRQREAKAPEPICNQCGVKLRPGVKFCTDCGTAVAG